MRSVIAPVLLVIAMTGCGSASKDETMSSNIPETNAAAATTINLSSSAFADGQPIPVKYGCDQHGGSPPLSWSNLPDGTKSVAIAIDDPDAKKAPGGVFRHWAAYDIPATTITLPEGAGKPGNPDFKQSLNDGGKPGYTPMCPPRGDPPHHYHFRLFALDVPTLAVPAGAKVKDVENAAEQHKLAEAQMIGTFERK